jgi:membrane associated rhomboid family serine protease
MIPLGDVIPVRTRPYVSVASMAAIPIAGGPLIQIAANILALWVFGRTVEDRMGHGRFAAFCAISGAVAATAQTMLAASSPLANVIASGAVSAVVGAYFVLYPQSKVAMLVPVGISLRVIEVPAFALLAVWFLAQTVAELGSLALMRGSPVPGLIPSWAHLVGFAIGAGGVMVFRRPERQRVEWWNDRPPSHDALRRRSQER